jgi:MFS family permease
MTSAADDAPAPPPPPAAAAPLPRNVKLLGATSLLNDIASEMLAPLLPAFLLSLPGGSHAFLGLIDGVGETASSLLKLWSGAWSDRAGRRKGFIAAGYGLAVLVRPLIALASVPWHILACNSADRVGKGIRTAPRDALIAESTPTAQQGRAFGFHRAMDHLGAAIGPLLAFGFLWLWPGQLRWLFALSILPGIPILLIIALGLQETARPHATKPDEARSSGWSLARFPASFPRYLVALLVFTLGNSSDKFLIVRAQELGVRLVWVPILWMLFHLAKSAGNVLCGGLVDRWGTRPLIWAGWLLYAAVYLAFGLATQAWQVWALFLLYAGFYALTEPAEKALVARLVGPQHKGLAFGWFNLTIGIAALPASLLFGWVYDAAGALAAFGMGAGFALAAAALLALVRER